MTPILNVYTQPINSTSGLLDEKNDTYFFIKDINFDSFMEIFIGLDDQLTSEHGILTLENYFFFKGKISL